MDQVQKKTYLLCVSELRFDRYYSVEENILLPLGYKFGNKTKEKKHEVDVLLARLGISYVKDRKIKNLSGGEKQRISIARALISDMTCILSDESTGALEEKTGMRIMGLFQELKEEGKTIIIVTHDVDIAQMCDRVIRI